MMQVTAIFLFAIAINALPEHYTRFMPTQLTNNESVNGFQEEKDTNEFPTTYDSNKKTADGESKRVGRIVNRRYHNNNEKITRTDAMELDMYSHSAPNDNFNTVQCWKTDSTRGFGERATSCLQIPFQCTPKKWTASNGATMELLPGNYEAENMDQISSKSASVDGKPILNQTIIIQVPSIYLAQADTAASDSSHNAKETPIIYFLIKKPTEPTLDISNFQQFNKFVIPDALQSSVNIPINSRVDVAHRNEERLGNFAQYNSSALTNENSDNTDLSGVPLE